jgi:hypothetical protein
MQSKKKTSSKQRVILWENKNIIYFFTFAINVDVKLAADYIEDHTQRCGVCGRRIYTLSNVGSAGR